MSELQPQEVEIITSEDELFGRLFELLASFQRIAYGTSEIMTLNADWIKSYHRTLESIDKSPLNLSQELNAEAEKLLDELKTGRNFLERMIVNPD